MCTGGCEREREREREREILGWSEKSLKLLTDSGVVLPHYYKSNPTGDLLKDNFQSKNH
ncbi:MAG: hypothetical protein KTM48_01970 [Wolbachia endosymbiont of Pissodes strobi]|nr:hypothetical protein [Wolbachia endosymbiont of Pissodes strobi]